jgi:hypothetical protein
LEIEKSVDEDESLSEVSSLPDYSEDPDSYWEGTDDEETGSEPMEEKE